MKTTDHIQLLIAFFLTILVIKLNINDAKDEIKSHQDACKVAIIKRVKALHEDLRRLIPAKEYRPDTTKIRRK